MAEHDGQANAEEVSWDSTSRATPIGPNELRVELTVTIAGGTGKFAAATGGLYAEYVATVHFDTMTATYSFVGTGTITY